MMNNAIQITGSGDTLAARLIAQAVIDCQRVAISTQKTRRRHFPNIESLVKFITGVATFVAAAGHASAYLLLPFIGTIKEEEIYPETQILDENGRRVFLAIVRLKERGAPIRQSDIAREAGIGERTLATYRARNAMLAGLIDSAILFCLDQHILKTGKRLEHEGGPVNYARIALEALVAVETLRRRREANKDLNRALEDIISLTHPSDVKIMAAVGKLKQQHESCTYSGISREADIDPATLRTRMYANPRVRDAVNSIILSTDNRILKAIESLVAENVDFDQRTIAEYAGLDPATVTNRKNHNLLIKTAIEKNIRSTDERILAAVEKLSDQNTEITQNIIAMEAGVTAGTIIKRKEQNTVVRRLVDDAVSNCTYRRIAATIRNIDAEGIPVTQQLIALRLGLTDAAISYHKDTNPDIHELIEAALPLSAVNRTRQAIDELIAEDIQCTRKNISLRAGITQATVSKIIATNPELALNVVHERNRTSFFTCAETCRNELSRRIRTYGNEICNTATALRKPSLRGGNPSLLRACRRLGIRLPVPATSRFGRLTEDRTTRPEYNSLNIYLERISSTGVLLEEEAVFLREQAMRSDKDAQEELIVRARPLVKFVIEKNLNETIDPFGFKTDLLWHLITEGDMVIASAWSTWDGKGYFLGYLRRQLQDALAISRRDFFKKRRLQTIHELSINEPLSNVEGSDNLTLEHVSTMAAGNIPADEVLNILSEGPTYGEEDLITQRDAESGVPVLSSFDKQILASTLKPIFTSLGLNRILEGGFGNRWAVLMASSLGRMGTAVVGDCTFKAIVLTDTTSEFLRQSIRTLAEMPGIESSEKTDGIQMIIIGRAENYDRIMAIANDSVSEWSGLRHLVMSLQRFGIGLTPEEGIATIHFIPVGCKPSETVLFELLKNGLPCAESEPGARTSLTKNMLQHLRNGTPEDSSRALLDTQISFLKNQRFHLEKIKQAK